MKISVLYHAHCWDGFCAAWLLWLVHGDDGVEYIPVNYGQDPPVIQGEKVMIVDFSYKRDVLLKLKEEHPDLIVLDHHKTAKEELEGLEYCIFDMEKSGARLTFEYLVQRGENVPISSLWLVDYTEDRDLWKWELPDSKAVNSAMRSYPLDFKVWDDMALFSSRKLVPEGEAILRAEAGMVELAVKNAESIIFHGHETCILNATSLISEIGNKICENKSISLSYFITKDCDVVVSMRSKGLVDVSAIAKEYDGGGHNNAAGFKTDFASLELMLAGGYA